MKPFTIADTQPRVGLQGIGAVLLQPFVGIEEEVLLAPQHAGQRLPHDRGPVVVDFLGCY